MKNKTHVQRAVSMAVAGRTERELNRKEVYEEAALLLDKRGLNPAAYPTVQMYLHEELDKLNLS